jgi:hypothetical protein
MKLIWDFVGEGYYITTCAKSLIRTNKEQQQTQIGDYSLYRKSAKSEHYVLVQNLPTVDEILKAAEVLETA